VVNGNLTLKMSSAAAALFYMMILEIDRQRSLMGRQVFISTLNKRLISYCQLFPD
jgi:hypothetical protein